MKKVISFEGTEEQFAKMQLNSYNFPTEELPKVVEISDEDAEITHNKLREILRSYGNQEWGDCIVDEISFLFGFPTTTDINPQDY